MGAWGSKPFENDSAADWAWELEDESTWSVVEGALRSALAEGDDLDGDTATIAVAAAEVVAHGVGRPTEVDGYTSEVAVFVARAGAPTPDLVLLAIEAVTLAGGPGELAELWEDDEGWRSSVTAIVEALRG